MKISFCLKVLLKEFWKDNAGFATFTLITAFCLAISGRPIIESPKEHLVLIIFLALLIVILLAWCISIVRTCYKNLS